jgi:segregation and condensation protein A
MTDIDLLPEEGSSYSVRLGMFEGPLDLLLHLIKKNEINILDIPISLITEQYLDYLKFMKELNLDVAGDYLLMAATLLHIKSKMLLPTPSVEEEGGEPLDPRAELVRRLLAYQQFKEAASDLEKRPLLERDVFVRPAAPEPDEPKEERLEVNLFELLEAFRQVLDRVKPEVFHDVFLERITVEEKIQEILSRLEREKRSFAFHTLFSEEASRLTVVVTLLAILELVKLRQIRLFQAAPFETIRVSPV